MEIKVQAAQGVPLTCIAAKLGIDPKTARKLRDAQAEPTVTVRRRKSKLDGHAEWIGDRLKAGVPAAQLQRDLKRQGVTVAYPTLRDFARKLRPAKAAEEEVRFETPPAKQAQCDWSEVGTIVENGVILALHVFVMVLGYSAKTFAAFATSMDELTLQRLHVAAFCFFGGDAWIAEANTRVHRTHGEVVDERFAREAPLLTRLRADLRIIGIRVTRRVNVEGFIEYRASRYEVPSGHRGRTVLVRDDGRHVRIYAADTLLCEHPTAIGRGQILRTGGLHPALARQLATLVVEHRPLSVYDEVSQ